MRTGDTDHTNVAHGIEVVHRGGPLGRLDLVNFIKNYDKGPETKMLPEFVKFQAGAMLLRSEYPKLEDNVVQDLEEGVFLPAVYEQTVYLESLFQTAQDVLGCRGLSAAGFAVEPEVNRLALLRNRGQATKDFPDLLVSMEKLFGREVFAQSCLIFNHRYFVVEYHVTPLGIMLPLNGLY